MSTGNLNLNMEKLVIKEKNKQNTPQDKYQQDTPNVLVQPQQVLEDKGSSSDRMSDSELRSLLQVPHKDSYQFAVIRHLCEDIGTQMKYGVLANKIGIIATIKRERVQFQALFSNVKVAYTNDFETNEKEFIYFPFPAEHPTQFTESSEWVYNLLTKTSKKLIIIGLPEFTGKFTHWATILGRSLYLTEVKIAPERKKFLSYMWKNDIVHMLNHRAHKLQTELPEAYTAKGDWVPKGIGCLIQQDGQMVYRHYDIEEYQIGSALKRVCYPELPQPEIGDELLVVQGTWPCNSGKKEKMRAPWFPENEQSNSGQSSSQK